MEIQALHDAIFVDPTSKALADAGNDAGCALAIAPLLPAVLVSLYVNERGVIAAFANPADGEAAMAGIEAAAAANALLARALKWLQPSNGGIDLGNAAVRAMLDTLEAAGALPASAVTTLKALAESPQAVTASDVSAAWAQYRPNGIIVSS